MKQSMRLARALDGTGRRAGRCNATLRSGCARTLRRAALRNGTQALHHLPPRDNPDFAMHDLRDVGGTPGGLGTFLFGLGLAIVGGYLLLDRVTVTGGYWGWFGAYGSSFGITLIPLLIGIGLLFFDGRSVAGTILTWGGLLIVVAGVIANMRIHFQPTSLFQTLVILTLLASGVGLMARAARTGGADHDEPGSARGGR